MVVSVPASADIYEEVLRAAALSRDALPPPPPVVDAKRAALGGKLFQEKRLSFNDSISCATCHIDQFAATDGNPNAVGVLGRGEGPPRALSGGAIVPRNVLPFWGRGGQGFNMFFWDGRVELKDDWVRSVFGDLAPSKDPLVVAVHLPFVEVREMVVDNAEVDRRFKKEDVDAAAAIYRGLTSRLAADSEYAAQFKEAYDLAPEQITFLQAADAIASFIRTKFALVDTKFSLFLKGAAKLTETEVRGGTIFYGKGRCTSCHAGPYFTDFQFHAIPFQQVGFGKNGFGIDYGRFNATHNPRDLYKFRTPPLLNVAKTAPYGHAGSTYSLADAVTAHFDPLKFIQVGAMDAFERVEYYRRLLAAAEDFAAVPYLDDEEVKQLVAFLGTLNLVN